MRNIDTIRNENNTITFNKDTEIGLYIIEAQQNGRTINTYETFDWEEAKNFWNHEAMYWVCSNFNAHRRMFWRFNYQSRQQESEGVTWQKSTAVRCAT